MCKNSVFYWVFNNFIYSVLCSMNPEFIVNPSSSRSIFSGSMCLSVNVHIILCLFFQQIISFLWFFSTVTHTHTHIQKMFASEKSYCSAFISDHPVVLTRSNLSDVSVLCILFLISAVCVLPSLFPSSSVGLSKTPAYIRPWFLIPSLLFFPSSF